MEKVSLILPLSSQREAVTSTLKPTTITIMSVTAPALRLALKRDVLARSVSTAAAAPLMRTSVMWRLSQTATSKHKR